MLQGFYIYSVILVKATEFRSQLYIKCFNKAMNHNPENLLVVTECYIYSFFLVKATVFWSQFCIECFSKSSCMMLRPFPFRLMNFMISYRIRSRISFASPQFSAQMSQTVITIFLIMILKTWSLNIILLSIL